MPLISQNKSSLQVADLAGKRTHRWSLQLMMELCRAMVKRKRRTASKVAGDADCAVFSTVGITGVTIEMRVAGESAEG
jgi:hypothetical protein